MSTMTRLTGCCFVIVVCASWCSAAALVDLTVRQIQETTLADGVSSYYNYADYLSNINCSSGGIVIRIFPGSIPRLQLYDPNELNGWGAIQVKGLLGPNSFLGISEGDRLSFENIPVEEKRGTTFLNYDSTAVLVQGTSGNPLPEPLLVSASEIAAPAFIGTDLYNRDHWEKVVADHSAEKYESMLLKIMNVSVKGMGLGKEPDNYNLQTASGDGDNVWAADYLNVDVEDDLYHWKVSADRSFDSVTGMLEQYTNDSTGWDYYQLLTTSGDDLVIPEPASMLLLVCGAAWLVAKRRR